MTAIPDKQTNSTDFAVTALRDRIFRGAIAPGTRLLEVPLAKDLGISRTPLRQALLELEREGLVERKTTTGFVVRSLTFSDVCDAIDLRGLLEGAAARRAAERGVPDAMIAQMNETLNRIDTALTGAPGKFDLTGYADGNRDFHHLIVDAAQSRVLRDEIARAETLPFSSPSAFLLSQRDDLPFQRSLLTSQAQHRAVVDAITRREGARAENLMREHARIALTNLEYIMGLERSARQQVPGLALVVD
ncbi:GntR family transcriptional regulator [Actibacterium lipolyticum]|uniref:Putative HTH-type transcriptional regulator YdfH n=1 Tax=Actibacterium lipolyticum TaxID=1524263 RepID=A0A238L8W8_9RHOB|nr:GntR family transcriptional regulator [Actibacterium lipolyticum]SMX51270.1 putative HTH-type transcriptional regulator YdfH [Actibacterium lipolyticum]